MRSSRALLFSIACLMGAASSLDAEERRTAPTILGFVSLWLESEYQLAESRSLPEIIAVPAQQLVVRRYGQVAKADPGEIVALYDDEAGAILVSNSWTGGSIAELSVLVHEMVHHMQREAGTVFPCPAEREKLAYRAQDAFLGIFGQDLESAFGIDPALILVATACVH